MAENEEANDKKNMNNAKLFGNDHPSQNVADQASKNHDAELNTIPDDDDVDNDDNPDRPTAENTQSFNSEDAKNTTMGKQENSDYIGDDEPVEMGDDLDADLDAVRDELSDEQKALQKLNLNDTDSLNHMRDILLHMNRTQSTMYQLVDYYAKNTMEYRKIKDNLVDGQEKGQLKSLLSMWQPLFKVSDENQVNTFVKAVNSIQEIVKDGSLDNLNRLAHYFNKNRGKVDVSKVKADTDEHREDDSSDHGKDDSTDRY